MNKEKKKKEKVRISAILNHIASYYIKIAPVNTILKIVIDIAHGISFGVITLATQSFLDTATAFSKGETTISVALLFLLMLGAVHLINRLLNAVANYMPGIMWTKVAGYLRKDAYRKISKLSPEVFEDTDKLDDINKAMNGISGAMSILMVIEISITFYASYFIFMAWYLFGLKPILVLAIVFVFIPNVISQFVRMKIFDKAEDKAAPARRELDYYERCITDREYYKETRLLGAFSYFKRKYIETLDLLQSIQIKSDAKNGVISIVTTLIGVAGYCGVILLAFHAVMNREISIGAFAAVLSSIGALYNLMNELIEFQIGNLSRNLPMVSNYMRFLKLPERQGEQVEMPEQCDIRLENVSYSYPKAEEYAVKDVSISINAGETVAIVGENGSGKSTLIRLITGLYKPSNGTVFYGDKNINDISYHSLFKNISAVFQKYQRYQMTLKENISISDSKKNPKENELERICKVAGVDCDSENYPEKWDTMLSREFDGVDLSGGQWQRIAIARAFFKTHGFILLDEPTAAIDPYEETRIYNKFAEISKDKTAIIVTHRLGSVKLADRVFVMKDGEVVQCGTHEQLLRETGEYQRLWAAQEQWYK